MARKKKVEEVAPEETASEETASEETASEETASEETETKAPAQKKPAVPRFMATKFSMAHPSSGVRFNVGVPTQSAEDGWVLAQVGVGLLEKCQ